MAEACYRPELAYYQASFKGFEFEATEAEREGGRRGAEGQFPFGETTAFQDLGLHIRTFPLKARFAKNSHVQDSMAFQKVLESPGPGTLVHPEYGAVRCSAKKFHFSTKILEGAGVTEVSLTFVEAPLRLANIASAALGGLDISGLVSAAETVFTANYAPELVTLNQLDAVGATDSNIVSSIKAAFDLSTGIATDANVWRISEELDAVATTAALQRKPTVVWEAISNGVAAVNYYGTSSASKVLALRNVINAAGSLSVWASGSAATAQEAVISTARIIAGAQLAKVLVATAATTLQSACREYRIVRTVLEEEAAAARARCDDELYLAINETLVEAQTKLLARVYGAPPIVSYDFGGPVWSVVAAHEIYGDARRASEIESLNSSSMPWLLGPDVSAVSPNV